MFQNMGLTSIDLKIWFKNALIFSAPIFLAGLLALQNGVDYRIALTMMSTSALTALIDITRRFISESK